MLIRKGIKMQRSNLLGSDKKNSFFFHLFTYKSHPCEENQFLSFFFHSFKRVHIIFSRDHAQNC